MMISQPSESEPKIDTPELLRPSLSFETITLSDGTSIALEEDDIVVFVGPNNAGKSAALRELAFVTSIVLRASDRVVAL